MSEIGERTGGRIDQRADGPSISAGPRGAHLIVVDPSETVAELLGDRLRDDGHRVEVITTAAAAMEVARQAVVEPPDLAITALSFPDPRTNGLDVVLAFHRWCPETAVVVYAEEGSRDDDLLRVVWEGVRPASAVSKLSSLTTLTGILDRVLETGRADVDPRLRPPIPPHRTPGRSADGYRRLMPHAGHAKLWRALIEEVEPPSYKDIAARTGLSVNTIRNYRDDLLAELRTHGFDSPSLQEMHRFAGICRPFLQAAIEERLTP